MTPEEIEFVLREHKKYLNGDGGVRADLRNADLCNADLDGAHLSCANLSGANLSGANLSGANLRSADLRDADLSGADLCSSNLHGADLRGAEGHGIIRIDIVPWSVCIYPDNRCSIGCETHDHEFWLNATPESVAYMHMRAAAWWDSHGPMIKAAIRYMEEKVC